jgi:hypothetical protein
MHHDFKKLLREQTYLLGCHCFLPSRSIRLRREESPAGFELAKPEAATGGLLHLPEENLMGLDLLSGLSPNQARQVQLRWAICLLKYDHLQVNVIRSLNWIFKTEKTM